MSENKHTPEPWAIDPDDRPNMHWNNHIVSEANPNIAICFMAHDGTEQNERGEANARRVVACVNACAGIPTEALESGEARSVRDELATIAELEKQRDELLAELKSISKITGDAGFNIGGPLEHCPGEIDHDEAKRLLILACEYLKDTSKAAHRAIASVKGGAA